MADIKYAELGDLDFFLEQDRHITVNKRELLEQRLEHQQIIKAVVDEKIIAWLRFSYLWGDIPFMNFIFVSENYRRKGIGARLLSFWKKEMQKKCFKTLMTSSLADEQGQFFHRKHGFEDCGCFILDDEALEIIFKKKI